MARTENEAFSIENILCEEEPLTCQFKNDAAKLGWLDVSNPRENLKQHTAVDLPYWSAIELLHRHLITTELPHVFTERFSENAKADPTVVDIQSRTGFFYSFGRKMVERHDEINAPNSDPHGILDLLEKLLTSRYVHVIEQAQVHMADDFREAKGMLSDVEAELFDIKYFVSKVYSEWKNARMRSSTTPRSVSRSGSFASSSDGAKRQRL